MGGGPFPGPSDGARVDPRQKLPSLSAELWMDALRNLVRTTVPRAVQDAAIAMARDHQIHARIDDFFSRSAGRYTVNGVDVAVMPFFRMANGHGGPSEMKKSRVFTVTGSRSAEFKLAVHRCTYGRCSPDELRSVTQALIDAGTLDEVRKKYDAMPYAEFQKHGLIARPLDDANAIKLLQWEYGLGIDCAGYVQLAFLDVHGGTRQTYGFESIGNGSFRPEGKQGLRPRDDTRGHAAWRLDLPAAAAC